MPASDPPATEAAASCMPGNAGLSARPMPIAPRSAGSAENRRTASTYSGRWTRSSSSSVAGSGARDGSAPTDRRRSMPGPNRLGVSGWPGPKSYVVDRGPKTSSGPWLGMPGTIPRTPSPNPACRRPAWTGAGPNGTGPNGSTDPLLPSAHGHPRRPRHRPHRGHHLARPEDASGAGQGVRPGREGSSQGDRRDPGRQVRRPPTTRTRPSRPSSRRRHRAHDPRPDGHRSRTYTHRLTPGTGSKSRSCARRNPTRSYSRCASTQEGDVEIARRRRPAARARCAHASTRARPMPCPRSAGATPSIRNPASPGRLHLGMRARVVTHVADASEQPAVVADGNQHVDVRSTPPRVAHVVEIGVGRIHVRLGQVGLGHQVARGVELIIAGKPDRDAAGHDPTRSASSASGSWTGWRQAKSRQTNAVARPCNAKRWARRGTELVPGSGVPASTRNGR